jgi:hypothetical protein
MTRYILRFRGAGAKPAADVERVRALPHATVLDDTRRMLLVEAPAEELEGVLKDLPDWSVSEEQVVTLPDPRPHVRGQVIADEDE